MNCKSKQLLPQPASSPRRAAQRAADEIPLSGAVRILAKLFRCTPTRSEARRAAARIARAPQPTGVADHNVFVQQAVAQTRMRAVSCAGGRAQRRHGQCCATYLYSDDIAELLLSGAESGRSRPAALSDRSTTQNQNTNACNHTYLFNLLLCSRRRAVLCLVLCVERSTERRQRGSSSASTQQAQ